MKRQVISLTEAAERLNITSQGVSAALTRGALQGVRTSTAAKRWCGVRVNAAFVQFEPTGGKWGKKPRRKVTR